MVRAVEEIFAEMETIVSAAYPKAGKKLRSVFARTVSERMLANLEAEHEAHGEGKLVTLRDGKYDQMLSRKRAQNIVWMRAVRKLLRVIRADG